MTFPDYPIEPRSRASEKAMYLAARIAGVAVAAGVIVTLGAVASPRAPVSLTRSIDVKGNPAQVWAMIGPYCAIKDWHPAIGACTEDGKSTPTRTLTTKDGAAVFVERQTARDDATYRYSYTFVFAPVPVSHYSSTLKVEAAGPDASRITWSGAYTPDAGKEKAASDMLGGIYEAGLTAIQARLAK